MTEKQFLQKIASLKVKSIERVVALLWFNTIQGSYAEVTCAVISKSIENAGFGKQNPTRIEKGLSKDKRIVHGSGKNFKISITAMPELMDKYSSLLKVIPAEPSDSVIERDLFKNAKRYTQKVIHQLNASYDSGLYDCCAVMCRRLLETLIIESYEGGGFADEIKAPDGNFFMFSGLLNHVENNKQIQLGRGALRGLKDFKILGDLSAHNRRFNARKLDIDKIKLGLRITCEELLHLANQGP